MATKSYRLLIDFLKGFSIGYDNIQFPLFIYREELSSTQLHSKHVISVTTKIIKHLLNSFRSVSVSLVVLRHVISRPGQRFKRWPESPFPIMQKFYFSSLKTSSIRTAAGTSCGGPAGRVVGGLQPSRARRRSWGRQLARCESTHTSHTMGPPQINHQSEQRQKQGDLKFIASNVSEVITALVLLCFWLTKISHSIIFKPFPQPENANWLIN